MPAKTPETRALVAGSCIAQRDRGPAPQHRHHGSREKAASSRRADAAPKGALKARPTRCLSLVATPESIENIDPCIFPFEIRPATSPMLGGFNRLPRLFGAARHEQPLSDLRGDLRHLPCLLFILSDEGIDIALSIGDFFQRQPHGADAGTLRHLISVGRPTQTPGYDLPVRPLSGDFRTGSADSAIMRCFSCSSPACPRAGVSAAIRPSNWP